MKKFLILPLAFIMCLSIAACGAKEDTAPPVMLTDIAAEPAASHSIAPADLNELSTSSGEPMAEPFGEAGAPLPAADVPPDADAAEPAPADGEAEE